ncbi:AI-2E family transporter [Flaviaesturariibacter aridisoli]|uniref:AI-2E family transporter n=1 Tax=Flaviaesturariibacter aridisoli TaxID=2545761 RepID=A0A4R4E1M2_9BACT|nr:AI-2E family transporter [Flaviaesturariibacter aridisoli]TCZ72258.1 AI-2E family transporter [Flaviaesturariibacter aridisoli]
MTTERPLLRTVLVFAVLIGAVVILYYARPFLVPLTFAALFAMLLLPAAQWLERKGWKRGWASLGGLLLGLLIVAAIVSLIIWQVSGFADDASKMEQQLMRQFDRLRQQITARFGLSQQEQQQLVQSQKAQTPGKISGFLTGLLSGTATFLTSTILVFVYVFLFLYLRNRLRRFLLRLIPAGSKSTADDTLVSIQKVARRYLGGLSLMILCLWVFYSIGFSIVGVKNPFFFAILCGLLEIIPFVGNLTGTALTAGMALAQGGGTGLLIGILVTYGTVQFLQTYILEPLVVGAGVSINPLFTIAGIVAGELLWGIPGMVLAIPLIGMFKIVCDHVDALEPYGYLMGQDKSEGGLGDKLKKWLPIGKKS